MSARHLQPSQISGGFQSRCRPSKVEFRKPSGARDSIILTMNVFSNQPNNLESMWMIPAEPVEHVAHVLEILSLEQSTN